jgi:hypothetical protein
MVILFLKFDTIPKYKIHIKLPLKRQNNKATICLTASSCFAIAIIRIRKEKSNA